VTPPSESSLASANRRALQRTTQAVLAVVVGVAALQAASGRAHAEECPDTPPTYLSLEAPVRDRSGPQVGKGAYSYRFVVRNPSFVNQPFRRGRYQVSLQGAATFPDGSQFFRGRTDSLGRTATFRFPDPILGDESWAVWPLVGRGEMGQTLELQAQGGGPCARLAGRSYLIDDVVGPIFCGKTLPNGLTARFMTPKPATLRIFTNFQDRECRRLRDALNPIMASASLRARMAGLQALIADPHFADASDLLEEKLEAQRYRYGSIVYLRAFIERELKKAPLESHADILNYSAYSLLELEPPRLIAFADGLLDRSLALAQDIFNTDSKGWCLHLQGRDQEALGWVTRSIARFKSTCSESEREALPIAFIHRGVILWALERKAEALDDWAQAALFDSSDGWVDALPDEANLEATVRTRAQRLRADNATKPLCSTVIEDDQERPAEVDQPSRPDPHVPAKDASVPDARPPHD
jgi:hypothetical protein